MSSTMHAIAPHSRLEQDLILESQYVCVMKVPYIKNFQEVKNNLNFFLFSIYLDPIGE